MVTNSYIVADLIILFYYIRMISEELCDTEDWSNDAEHSALIAFDMFKSKTVISLFTQIFIVWKTTSCILYNHITSVQ